MTPRRKRIESEAKLEELRQDMEQRQIVMSTMKIAYMNRTPFEQRVPTAEDLRAAAQSFIEANHAYQKALYGRVRIKLSVANLLR